MNIYIVRDSISYFLGSCVIMRFLLMSISSTILACYPKPSPFCPGLLLLCLHSQGSDQSLGSTSIFWIIDLAYLFQWDFVTSLMKKQDHWSDWFMPFKSQEKINQRIHFPFHIPKSPLSPLHIMVSAGVQ